MNFGRVYSNCFLWALGAALLGGCANSPAPFDEAASYRHFGEIKGTLTHGRYVSPDANFSCAIPELADPGAAIKDVSGKSGQGRSGTVTFQDDLGTLLRVDWLEIAEIDRPKIADPGFDRAAEESFSLLMFTQYQQVSRSASLVAHEYLPAPGEEKLFVASLLPGGSTLVEKRTGQRLDAYRASLFLRHGNWVYCLSTQSTIHPPNAAPALAATLAQLKQRLLVFQGSMLFP